MSAEPKVERLAREPARNTAARPGRSERHVLITRLTSHFLDPDHLDVEVVLVKRHDRVDCHLAKELLLVRNQLRVECGLRALLQQLALVS